MISGLLSLCENDGCCGKCENCGSDTLQELNDEFSTAYDQVIVFNSSFHTPKVSDGFRAADVEDSGFYWYLGRKNGGSWEVINAGY